MKFGRIVFKIITIIGAIVGILSFLEHTFNIQVIPKTILSSTTLSPYETLLAVATFIVLLVFIMYLEERLRPSDKGMKTIGGTYRLVNIFAIAGYLLLRSHIGNDNGGTIYIIGFIYLCYVLLVVLWNDRNYNRTPLLGVSGRYTRFYLDIIFAFLFVYSDGGVRSPLVYLYVLPTITASRYFTSRRMKYDIAAITAMMIISLRVSRILEYQEPYRYESLLHIALIVGLINCIGFIVRYENRIRVGTDKGKSN